MMYIVNLNKHDVDSKIEGLSGIPVLWAGHNVEIKPDCIYDALPEYGKNIAERYKNRGIVVVEGKDILDDISSDLFEKVGDKDDTPKISKNERFTNLKIGALEQYLKFIAEAQNAYNTRQNNRRVKGYDLPEEKPVRLNKLVAVIKNVKGEIKHLKELKKKKKFPDFKFFRANSPWAGYIQDFTPGVNYAKDGVSTGKVPVQE